MMIPQRCLGPWGAWMLVTVGMMLLCDSGIYAKRKGKQKQHNKPDGLLQMIKRVGPRIRSQAGGPPVLVSCGIYVVGISSIDEINMDYTVDVYLRQFWNDPRFRYGDRISNDSFIQLPGNRVDQVWSPPIYFPHEKHAYLHRIITPTLSFKIHPCGNVFFSARLTLKVFCNMNLAFFPMDRQICELRIESFSLPTEHMLIEWKDDPVEVSPELELPQFKLVKFTNSTCAKNYSTGTFSCLSIHFHLSREFGFFLLQTYVPTMLIVILSWVSFWINMEAVPARISLGVTTVLTMATQLSGSKSSIPRVSYPKAIDVWMTMCMVFVFAALLEYAFVNALCRVFGEAPPTSTTESPEALQPLKQDFSQKEQDENHDQTSNLQLTKTKPESASDANRQNILVAQRLDRFSRFFFPVLFLCLNVLYWVYYMRF